MKKKAITKHIVRNRIAAKMVFVVIGTLILLTSTIQAEVTYDRLYCAEMLMIHVIENEASAAQQYNTIIQGSFDNLYADKVFTQKMPDTYLAIAPGARMIEDPVNFMAWIPPSMYKFEYVVSIRLGRSSKRYTIIKINQDGLCYDNLDGKLLIKHMHDRIVLDDGRIETLGVKLWITVRENFYRSEGVMAELNRHFPFEISSAIRKYATGEKTAIGLDHQYKVHPVETTVFSETPNPIVNGDFENWSGGTSSSPDWWEFEGSGAVERVEIGTYAAKLTGRTGCRLQSRIDNGLKNIDYWRSKTLTFGCWVYATKADTTRLQIHDSKGLNSSSYHTGNSTWQWLMVTRTVDPGAASLSVLLNNEGDTSSCFIGPMCAESTNPSTNLFPNGGFECWSSGTSSAPDGWTFGGVGAVKQVKIGRYAANLTGTTGCSLQYRIDNSLKNIDYWRSKTLTFGCWVYATKAKTTRLQIYAGIKRPNSSSYHTGNSTWQWLTVTCTVDPVADSVRACLSNEGDTAASKFCGPVYAEQSLASINRQDLEHQNSLAAANSDSLQNQTSSNTMAPEEDVYLNTLITAFANSLSVDVIQTTLTLMGWSAEKIRPMLAHLSRSEANCLPFANCRMPYKWGSSVEPIIIRTEHPSISVQGKIPSGVLFRLPVTHFNKGDRISMRGNIKEGKIDFGVTPPDERAWMGVKTLGVGEFDSTVTIPYEGDFLPLFMCDKNLGIDATITDISLP